MKTDRQRTWSSSELGVRYQITPKTSSGVFFLFLTSVVNILESNIWTNCKLHFIIRSKKYNLWVIVTYVFLSRNTPYLPCAQKKSNSNCGFERCICFLKYYECEADPSKRIEWDNCFIWQFLDTFRASLF